MVNIVHISFAATQLEHVLERIDQVLAAQGHDGFGHVLIELAVDAEAPDAAEPIAIFIEEFFLEEGLGLVFLRRVAGAKTGVNLQQRALVAVGRVFGERVEDQRIVDLGHALDALERGALNFVEGFGDLRAGLDDLFAIFRIDNR